MKKLINSPDNVVPEMLEGISKIHSHIQLIENTNIIVRSDILQIREKQVTLISGGGSGHEPAHGLYVAKGMLSAAVCGNVFTSPDVQSIVKAILTCTTPTSPGCLLIVKNYTGDVLNFKLAAEIAREQKRKVETVIVADDVALIESKSTTGRRGIAGTVFVHKICGALAESGASLEEIKKVAEKVVQNVNSMGVSLGNCVIPGSKKPAFQLKNDEIELGLGIHGEAGTKREKIKSASAIVGDVVSYICKAVKPTSGERIALMVNNLGGTTNIELYIVANAAISELEKRGFVIERIYIGPFMTALEMHGISLSVLKVDDNLINYLDMPTISPAWPSKGEKPSEKKKIEAPKMKPPTEYTEQETGLSKALEDVITLCAKKAIESEQILTDMDRICGDGDMGINLARGAKNVLSALPNMNLSSVSATLYDISMIVQGMGGTSGAVFSMFLLKMAQEIKKYHKHVNNPIAWAKALESGINGITSLSGAVPGDRTVVDALAPALKQMAEILLSKSGKTFSDITPETISSIDIGHIKLSELAKRVASAAEDGANSTKQMVPKKGRASYLGDKVIGTPDPGATSVSLMLNAWYSYLNKQ